MTARRIAAPAAVLGGAGAGLLLGLAMPSGGLAVDPDLTLLLRFMAAIKGGAALGAAALGAWRVSRGVPARVAAGHAVAAALMGLGSGLIWTLAHVALGAGIFYAGVAAFAACAWGERGHVAVSRRPARAQAVPRRAGRRHADVPIHTATAGG